MLRLGCRPRSCHTSQGSGRSERPPRGGPPCRRKRVPWDAVVDLPAAWCKTYTRTTSAQKRARGGSAPGTIIVSKDVLPAENTYSGFAGGDLDRRLREQGVRRVFVGGLATDYCVFHTVKDALARGYAAVLLTDAIRAVNVEPDDGRKAEAEMVRLGAVPIRRDLLAA